MGETTAIGWTDHTFNPWWGCTKIQAPDGERSACDHCYAETFAKRTGNLVWGKNADRRLFTDKHWAEPLRWDRAARIEGRRHRVFCASMADVFEDRRDLDEPRTRLFTLIGATPNLDWQLLTKRPEQMNRLTPDDWRDEWPPNAWAGTTVEDQRAASLRIPRLLTVPATIRFLSCEPIFTAINLTPWITHLDGQAPPIAWVIAGGESGPHHQPLNPNHARQIRDDCVTAGIPFFFKQDSGQRPGTPGPPDLSIYKEFPHAIS